MGIKLTHFFFSWLITCTNNNPNTPLHFGPTVNSICRIMADGASARLPSPSATATVRWKDHPGTFVSANLWMRWGLRCFHFHTCENPEAEYVKSSKGGMLCADRSSRRDKEIQYRPSSRWRDDISCSILSDTATELMVIIDPVLTLWMVFRFDSLISDHWAARFYLSNGFFSFVLILLLWRGM